MKKCGKERILERVKSGQCSKRCSILLEKKELAKLNVQRRRKKGKNPGGQKIMVRQRLLCIWLRKTSAQIQMEQRKSVNWCPGMGESKTRKCGNNS